MSAIDLRLGDWREVLADVDACDSLICDPPYSERTDAGYRTNPGALGDAKSEIPYDPITRADAVESRGFEVTKEETVKTKSKTKKTTRASTYPIGWYGRQGDVHVERIADATETGERVGKEGGRVVLAHGEVTGHAHAIETPSLASLFALTPSSTKTFRDLFPDLTTEALAGCRILKVKKRTRLVHEEHGAIPLNAGTYAVVRQQEYQEGAFNNVAD